MSDCPQTSNERWTLGELGYLDRPISKRRRQRIQKEWEEQAKHRAERKREHRERYPEQYDADGNLMIMW
jgi:hypothetical protein|tara:strand:+ start:381 stop:587 length:207 start_codon:yes stop_codon:yes gene_type:complete